MPPPDPNLTPDRRLRELAALLAAGLRRLRTRPSLSPSAGRPPGPEKSLESRRDCLELPGETVLSVTTG